MFRAEGGAVALRSGDLWDASGVVGHSVGFAAVVISNKPSLGSATPV